MEILYLLDIQMLTFYYKIRIAYLKQHLHTKWIFFKGISLLHAYEYFACMYVCVACTCSALRPEWDIGFPGPGIMEGCELPCGCWEVNHWDCLQEQPMLLNTTTLHRFYSFIKMVQAILSIHCLGHRHGFTRILLELEGSWTLESSDVPQDHPLANV